MLDFSLTRAACVLGLVALAGCQAMKSPAPTSSSSAALKSDYSQEGQEELQPKRKKTAMVAPAERPRPTQDSGKKSQDAELPDIGAIGTDESTIRALFGDPVSEVDDAPAKRLSYKTAACSVEFTLYPDVDTRTYRTLTLEVKNDDGTAKGQRLCVADLKSRFEDRRQEAR